jgi:hypothetical protein
VLLNDDTPAADEMAELRRDDIHRREVNALRGLHPNDPERQRLDEIEHAQDRDYWRTERERLDRIDNEDAEAEIASIGAKA